MSEKAPSEFVLDVTLGSVTSILVARRAKALEEVLSKVTTARLSLWGDQPGVSTLAGNSYVLNAVEYAKENPMTALWTAGPVVFSAVVGAARSTYNYFFPPQEGWLGGWDGGLLAGGAGATLFGGAAATTGWFGQPAPATSSWFGFGSQPAASSSWFGGGG
ncbi:unnamed protein product [Durusdinium trenchii]|uniref:Uncharacterized protein n=1 Tax=Durusdinium trenchii TaxID=1381693 RepID=A0ABP0Q792_9DINO